jgi:hypothetical protein
MNIFRNTAVICMFFALILFAAHASAQQAEQSRAAESGPEITGQVQGAGQDAESGAEADMRAQAIEDKPEPSEPDQRTPVFVVHTGDDALGGRLAFRLKENFNTASLFELTGDDVRKIKILVNTRTEFPGRPALGSIYSVTWIYQASENMLTHYLSSEIGVIPPDGLEELAEEIAARTEKVSTRYSYLFE